MFRVLFIDGEVGFPSTLRSAQRMSSGRKNCDGIVVVDWVSRWGSRLRKPTTKTRGHTRLRQVWDGGFFVGVWWGFGGHGIPLRGGARGVGFLAPHTHRLCGVCAAHPGQKSGGACLCRTVRGGSRRAGAHPRRKLLNAGLCGGVVGSAPHPQNTPQKYSSRPSSAQGFRPTSRC